MLHQPKTEISYDHHKSRWGYHPCSYEDFLKLKLTHKLLLRAYCDVKRWVRWYHKEPQNRKTEEPVHPSFLVHHGYHRVNERVFYGCGFAQYQNQNLYLHVLEQYQRARKPVATPAEVLPLNLPTGYEEIIKKLEAFYNS